LFESCLLRDKEVVGVFIAFCAAASVHKPNQNQFVFYQTAATPISAV
jgi:hypothetical protein